MSLLTIVLIVVAVLAVLFFVGGYIASGRRANRPGTDEHIRDADRALEQARAGDRGWDRELLHVAARRALDEQKPGTWESVELVLVDDRPGVAEDAAHFVAAGPDGQARIVLARTEGGDWYAERVE